MNLEHFQQIAQSRKYRRRLIQSNKKLFNLFLLYREEVSDYLKSQLRYGALTFEIIEHTIYNIPTYQEINIKYTRQIHNPQISDSTLYDFFRKKTIKKDYINVSSFLVALFVFLCALYEELHQIYCSWFPDIAYRSEIYDQILKYGLELSLKSSVVKSSYNIMDYNLYFASVITDFCIYFNIIF